MGELGFDYIAKSAGVWQDVDVDGLSHLETGGGTSHSTVHSSKGGDLGP